MKHKCDAIVFHCIDFRLHPATAVELPKALGMKYCDFVGVAGACKSFLDENGEFLLSQIDISVRAHNIDSVVIVNHLDCSAYGGSFPGERDVHIGDMNKAGDIINKRYPALAVIKVLATLTQCQGVWYTSFDVVDE